MVYSGNGLDIGLETTKTDIIDTVKTGKIETRLCFDSFKHQSPRPFEVRFDRMEYNFLRLVLKRIIIS